MTTNEELIARAEEMTRCGCNYNSGPEQECGKHGDEWSKMVADLADRLAARTTSPDAATEVLDAHRCDESAERAYKRTIRAEDERGAALAAIERVRAIHKVKHGEKPRYAADDYHAEREPVAWEKYSMCEGCSATWPCATIAALDGAPEPEWEYGNASENGFMYDTPSLAAAIENCASDTTVRRADGTVETYKRHVVRRRKAGPWLPVEGESK